MKILKRLNPTIPTYLGMYLVRLLLCTVRVKENQRNLGRILQKEGKHVIYAFWHSVMLVPGYHHRNLGIQILVSQHRDGEYIAKALASFGFETSRGSTTRGGARAMINLVKTALKKEKSIIITPDGPQGPRHIVQPGIIYIAKKSGFPIIPVGVKVSKYWELPSWDKFIIPKPFSQVTLHYGEPIKIPPRLNNQQFEDYRNILEQALLANTLDSKMGSR